mgnify:CR=1 FL=1
MNNVIIIKNKDNFMSSIYADDYLAIGRSGERLEMITNLKPQDLLILLMPILEELLEELHELVLD